MVANTPMLTNASHLNLLGSTYFARVLNGGVFTFDFYVSNHTSGFSNLNPCKDSTTNTWPNLRLNANNNHPIMKGNAQPEHAEADT